MAELHFSLLTDGPSDVVLLPILHWLLEQHLLKHTIAGTWVDVRSFKLGRLENKIQRVLSLYPCDLLLVHRDAEGEPKENRFLEVHQAVERAKPPVPVPVVCVVPVRMQEAWLLFDEAAIRRAAGNPNGKMPLSRPSMRSIEDRPDPKEDLYGLLKQASGLHGRRLKKFSESQHAQNVTKYIDDFSPLRALSAFQMLEKHLLTALKAQGWINE